MSRIKDLLAEVEGIDDLMPVRPSVKEIADGVITSCINVATEDEIANRAQFEVDIDDEGHQCLYLENYLDIISDIVVECLDEMIEQQHYDLTDTEYFAIKDDATSGLADYYADYESSLVRDAEEDYKYKLDELRERNGEC